MVKAGDTICTIDTKQVSGAKTSLESAEINLQKAQQNLMRMQPLYATGDIKASLIVGSSISASILAALILMSLMGYSLNMITLSALTLGVGMMVDNSIVVLESCFRVTLEQKKKQGLIKYAHEN